MSIRFPCGDVQLEGALVLPPGCTRGAVICHPHPQYGGNMENAVVRAVSTATEAAGLATLRFNFRGVGASSGVYGGGVGEIDDTKAAVHHLVARTGVSSVVLAGYSFGAMVVLQTASELDEVDRVVAIAPPLSFFDLASIASCNKPKLFVVGDRDQYCSIPHLQRELATLSAPKTQHIVPGADHFFLDSEQTVVDVVRAFASTV